MSGFKNKELAKKAGQKGSRAGVPNKITAEIRHQFNLLLENNIEQLQKDINALEPKDRVNALVKIASFVLPKLNAVDVTTGGQPIERYVTINLEENE